MNPNEHPFNIDYCRGRWTATCKKGNWSVDTHDSETMLREAYHYYAQYMEENNLIENQMSYLSAFKLANKIDTGDIGADDLMP